MQMSGRLFIWWVGGLLATLLFVSSCSLGNADNRNEDVLQSGAEERVEDVTMFLRAGDEYFYQEDRLYRTSFDSEKMLVTVYVNDGIQLVNGTSEQGLAVRLVSSEPSLEQNKLYVYENNVLVSSKIPAASIKYIYVNGTEERNRTYKVGLPGGSYSPEPLRGETLNEYFAGLNLTQEYVYGLIQFETIDGQPTEEQEKVLKQDGIALFESHGDFTYYAKIPTEFLKTQSLDFIRWAGLVAPEYKMNQPIKEILWGKNCSGRLNLNIILYEALTLVQFRELRDVSGGCNIGYQMKCDSLPTEDIIYLSVNAESIETIASLDFVKTIELYILPTIGFDIYDPLEGVECH